MKLYHERGQHRVGSLGPGDEEECFTAKGRFRGVWLTTEKITGPTVVSTVVSDSQVNDYEVTGDDTSHRVFVVPVLVAGGWPFS